MIVLTFLRYILFNLKNLLSAAYNVSRYKRHYPTCEFYPGVIVLGSQFEGYNVLFNDVILDGSEIGKHNYIQKKSTVFNAQIGRFCSIALMVSIGLNIHKIDGITTHDAFYLQGTPLVKRYSNKDLYQTSKRTVIGNDVWIGERSIILDGINIGNGAIIAAGSVVTKDVAPYTIVGGVPARFIKMRFDKETALMINASEWWNKPEEWLDANYIKFTDPADFLKLFKKN